jgi:UDP:flavonoid glycosyltransferase YjiC (YdhE family)
MNGQLELLRRIVAALDSLPVRGIVTTGPTIGPADVPSSLKPSASVAAIAAAVRRLLDDLSCRRHAQTLGAHLRDDVEHSPLIRELELVAGGSIPRPAFARRSTR